MYLLKEHEEAERKQREETLAREMMEAEREMERSTRERDEMSARALRIAKQRNLEDEVDYEQRVRTAERRLRLAHDLAVAEDQENARREAEAAKRRGELLARSPVPSKFVENLATTPPSSE